MKIAHIAVVTPRRCGLYETTRELVAAERDLGIDARIVDPAPTPLHPGGDNDRGAKFADESFAFEADVVVNHSGMDGRLDAVECPVIYASHGRPLSSFLGERKGEAPVYSYYYKRGYQSQRFDYVVTFWPEHVGYLQVMFPNTPVEAIPATCDLSFWKPDGPRGYGFHGRKGEVNCVIADAWRNDVCPFDAINAFILFSRQWSGAKLHIYGLDNNRKGIEPLLQVMKEEGTLGEVCGWTLGLENVYRAADVAITPQRILTRSIREAQACGCPVVSGEHFTPTGDDSLLNGKTPLTAIENAAVMIGKAVVEPDMFRMSEREVMKMNPTNAAKRIRDIAVKLANKELVASGN